MAATVKAKIGAGVLILLAIGIFILGLSGGFDGSGSSGGAGHLTAVSPAAPEAAPQTSPSPTYTADLSGKMPLEFHGGTMRKTKLGDRRYIAQTGTGGTAFTLANLPPHRFVHVTFDLALFNSWNGSNTNWGPDIWAANVVGGPELLRTTFGNCGFFSDNNEQDYPDQYPAPDGAVPHPAWTGSTEHSTLGEMHSWGSADRTFDCSAVYHMDWTFPNAESTLKLSFTSKPTKRDKLFGLLSFHVEALNDPAPLTSEQFNQAWTAIKSDDPIPANAAVWQLVAAGDAAVTMLEAQDLTKLSDYSLSRTRHVLQVVNTTAAQELLAKLH